MSVAFALADPDDFLAAASALAAMPPVGETASGRPWRLRPADERAALAIAQSIGVDFFVARALTSRGVAAAAAAAHLAPSLRDSLPDPFVLAGMEAATDRLARAILSGRTIGVFGDYDVDGVTASAIMHRYLRAVGVAAPVYLPDRAAEGYGPSIDAFRTLKAQGASSIVTVDCGSAAHAVVDEAAADGLEIVVVDHHQMDGPGPSGAAAIVNPQRADDASGLEGLSAAGLAFMVCVALNRRLRADGHFKARAEPDLLGLLDLAALGLVCDVMPMTGLTRVLVAQGLKASANRGNPGLRALAKAAGARGAPSAYHLGFLLGPRINAAGRIGHARLAFDLLTSDDPARCAALADRLHVMNAERQAIEAGVLEHAIHAAQAQTGAVRVVAGEGWHPGVVGIVAGRLKERFGRPAVVIGVADGVGKGSGRSISGVDLGAAIAAAREDGLLISGGGHAMAAGLTVAADRVEALCDFLNARLAADVDAARARDGLDVDGVLSVRAVNKAVADGIAAAGPFGPGAPEPNAVFRDVAVEDLRAVGAGHVAFQVRDATGAGARAIAFRCAGEPLDGILRAGKRLHLVGKIRVDDWRGGDAAQLHVVDAAIAP
ncbi:MAG: single-stranded-DNA-specific exonuclease RecJ [Pseudomonadota bacterium]